MSKRGGVLVDERLEFTTARLDGRRIRPAAKRPLRNNGRVRFFIGTSEISAARSARCLGRESVKQAEWRSWCQASGRRPVGRSIRAPQREQPAHFGGGTWCSIRWAGGAANRSRFIASSSTALRTHRAARKRSKRCSSLQDNFALSTLRIGADAQRAARGSRGGDRDSRFVKCRSATRGLRDPGANGTRSNASRRSARRPPSRRAARRRPRDGGDAHAITLRGRSARVSCAGRSPEPGVRNRAGRKHAAAQIASREARRKRRRARRAESNRSCERPASIRRT